MVTVAISDTWGQYYWKYFFTKNLGMKNLFLWAKFENLTSSRVEKCCNSEESIWCGLNKAFLYGVDFS